MTEPETVALLTVLLAEHDPFVHVRFGDGDVFFASGTGPRLTADGETWTPELGMRLEAAWLVLAGYNGRLLIGDVETYMVSDGCEEQWRDLVSKAEDRRGAPLEMVHIEALRASVGHAAGFYTQVARDTRKKVYVAPAGLKRAARMLGAIHLEAPLHVAHEHADSLTEKLIDLRPEVVLVSAGRGGKIIQAKLSVQMPDTTQIDVGSGLDVLFTDLRRGTDGRVDVEQLRATYRRNGLQL